MKQSEGTDRGSKSAVEVRVEVLREPVHRRGVDGCFVFENGVGKGGSHGGKSA
jgi:hypothetical protein